MAFSVKTNQLTGPGATGNQSSTDPGFLPKALVMWSGLQTAAGSSADAQFSLGWATGGSTETEAGYNSDDNVATSDVTRNIQTSNRILRLDTAGTTTENVGVNFTSFDATGFSNNWVALTTTSPKFNYLALGGTDIQVASGTFASNTTTGNQSVSSLSFQPDVVFFFTTLATTASSSNNNNQYGFGVMDRAGNQWSIAQKSANAQAAANTSRAFSNTRCLILPNTANNNLFQEMSFVSMNATGFTVNIDTAGGSAIIIGYLAIKGGNWKVGTDTQKTSTGTKATTGVGFTPSGVLFGSVADTQTAGTADHARLMIGASTGTANNVAVWTGDQDAADPMIADTIMSATKALVMATEGTPTTNAEADIDSFDSDGFTLDWTTADATARVFGYVAFGERTYTGPTVDGTVSSVIENTTLSHTTTADTDILVVAAGVHQGTISAVAFDGDALTKAVGAATAFNETAELWYLLNPTAKTANITLTRSGGSGPSLIGINVKDAKTSSWTPVTATNTGSDASIECDITTTSDDCLVIDSVYSEATLTVGSNLAQTQLANLQDDSFENAGASRKNAGEAGIYRMEWSLSSGQRWASALVAIEKAPAGGATLSVSVSDSITVSESVDPELVSFVNKSDSITVSEAVNMTLVHNIAKSETVTVSEAVTVSRQSANPSTLVDNFNDNSINANNWPVVGQDGGATVTEQNQRLEIALPASATVADYGSLRSHSIYDFTGSEAYVEITGTVSSATNANQVFIAETDADNWFRWVLEAGNLYAQYEKAGGGIQTVISFPFVAATHRWWRFRESGGDFLWDTSTDGLTWTNRASFTHGMTITSMRISIEAYAYQNETNPGTALFDNFNFVLNRAVSVSDTVTLSEAVDPELISFIAVSDSITVSESTKIELNSFVNESETITVSESVAVAIEVTGDLSVSVSDTITLSESIKVELNSFISVSDSITLTESVDPELVSFVSVSETINVTEAVNVALVHNVQTSESIFVLEGRNRVTNYSFEGDTPGDGNIPSGWTSFNTAGTPTYKGVANDFAKDGSNSFKIEAATAVDTGIRLNVTGFAFGSTLVATVFAKTTAAVDNAVLVLSNEQNGSGGNVTVQQNISGATEARMSVSGTMNSTASEIFLGLGAFGAQSDGTVWFDDVHVFVFEKVELVSDVRASETVTVSENATVQVPELGGISVSENITVTEATDIDVTIDVSESETVNVTDTPNVALAHQLSTSDTVTLSESSRVELNSDINVSETITLTENVAIAFESFNISVSETIVVSETIAVSIGDISLSVSESITVTDTPRVDLNSFVSVSDEISISESVDPELESNISVSENVTLTESVTMLETSHITVSESITVTDTPDPELVSNISVSDEITITESVDPELVSNISVSETVTLTENTVVAVPNLGGITVSESITVTDTPTMFTDILYLSVSETIVVTDISNVAHVLQVRATGETITLSESVAMNPPHIPDPPPTIIYLEDGTPLYRLTGVFYTKI